MKESYSQAYQKHLTDMQQFYPAIPSELFNDLDKRWPMIIDTATLIQRIEQYSNKDEVNYRKMVVEIKDYINSRNCPNPARYLAKSFFWDQLTSVSASDELNLLNQKLDTLLANLPAEPTVPAKPHLLAYSSSILANMSWQQLFLFGLLSSAGMIAAAENVHGNTAGSELILPLDVLNELALSRHITPAALNRRLIHRRKLYDASLKSGVFNEIEGLINKGQLDIAWQLLETQLAEWPDNAPFLAQKAIILIQQMKYYDAIKYLQKSIELVVDTNPVLRLNLVECYLKTGQYEEAWQNLEGLERLFEIEFTYFTSREFTYQFAPEPYHRVLDKKLEDVKLFRDMLNYLRDRRNTFDYFVHAFDLSDYEKRYQPSAIDLQKLYAEMELADYKLFAKPTRNLDINDINQRYKAIHTDSNLSLADKIKCYYIIINKIPHDDPFYNMQIEVVLREQANIYYEAEDYKNAATIFTASFALTNQPKPEELCHAHAESYIRIDGYNKTYLNVKGSLRIRPDVWFRHYEYLIHYAIKNNIQLPDDRIEGQEFEALLARFQCDENRDNFIQTLIEEAEYKNLPDKEKVIGHLNKFISHNNYLLNTVFGAFTSLGMVAYIALKIAAWVKRDEVPRRSPENDPVSNSNNKLQRKKVSDQDSIPLKNGILSNYNKLTKHLFNKSCIWQENDLILKIPISQQTVKIRNINIEIKELLTWVTANIANTEIKEDEELIQIIFKVPTLIAEEKFSQVKDFIEELIQQSPEYKRREIEKRLSQQQSIVKRQQAMRDQLSRKFEGLQAKVNAPNLKDNKLLAEQSMADVKNHPEQASSLLELAKQVIAVIEQVQNIELGNAQTELYRLKARVTQVNDSFINITQQLESDINVAADELATLESTLQEIEKNTSAIQDELDKTDKQIETGLQEYQKTLNKLYSLRSSLDKSHKTSSSRNKQPQKPKKETQKNYSDLNNNVITEHKVASITAKQEIKENFSESLVSSQSKHRPMDLPLQPDNFVSSKKKRKQEKAEQPTKISTEAVNITNQNLETANYHAGMLHALIKSIDVDDIKADSEIAIRTALIHTLRMLEALGYCNSSKVSKKNKLYCREMRNKLIYNWHIFISNKYKNSEYINLFCSKDSNCLIRQLDLEISPFLQNFKKSGELELRKRLGFTKHELYKRLGEPLEGAPVNLNVCIEMLLEELNGVKGFVSKVGGCKHLLAQKYLALVFANECRLVILGQLARALKTSAQDIWIYLQKKPNGLYSQPLTEAIQKIIATDKKYEDLFNRELSKMGNKEKMGDEDEGSEPLLKLLLALAGNKEKIKALLDKMQPADGLQLCWEIRRILCHDLSDPEAMMPHVILFEKIPDLLIYDISAAINELNISKELSPFIKPPAVSTFYQSAKSQNDNNNNAVNDNKLLQDRTSAFSVKPSV